MYVSFSIGENVSTGLDAIEAIDLGRDIAITTTN
jgi:hypothetical protein